MEYLVIGVGCLIGVVFLVSAASKLRRADVFAEFVASVRQLVALGPAWPRRIGLAVALAEAAIPVLLALSAVAAASASGAGRLATGAGFLLAGGLLAAFTVAILLALRRGVRTPCRCFGTSASPLGLRHVVRNSLLIAVVALGVAATFMGSVDAVHPGGAVVAAVAGLVAGILVTTFDDLVDLFITPPKAQTPNSR